MPQRSGRERTAGIGGATRGEFRVSATGGLGKQLRDRAKGIGRRTSTPAATV